MERIYLCKILNKEKEQLIPYKQIFNGNIREQITIFKIFQKNMKERENYLNIERQNNENLHVIPSGDPLYIDLYSNGYNNNMGRLIEDIRTSNFGMDMNNLSLTNMQHPYREWWIIKGLHHTYSIFSLVARNKYIHYSYSVRYLGTNIFDIRIWSHF